ncbi:MAG: hypothetical protein Q8834_02825, partial [Candidatus Phytoplasma australasiaticum]|nr:hypothetical protein [Candidatus Phytoplasma australasiaticum]
ERKKRDHKFINKEQNFFMFSSSVGPVQDFMAQGRRNRRFQPFSVGVLANGFWRHLVFRVKNPKISYRWVEDEPDKRPRLSCGIGGARVGLYGLRKEKQAISAIFRGC